MSASAYRSPGSEARHVRELVLARLPPVVRDRLAACFTGGGAPAPLLVDLLGSGTPRAQLFQLVAVAAALVEARLCFDGFGVAASDVAVAPPAYAALHVAAIFALLFGAVLAARAARARGGATYRDGRFLFALDLVEIVGLHLRVTALATLRRIDARAGKHGAAVVLVFADGHEVVFEAQPHAEALALSAKEAVDAALALSLPDDLPRLCRLDPFFELRVADDWASAEIEGGQRGSWLRRAPLSWLVAASFVVALVAGLGAHAARNRFSDDAMFERAVALNRNAAPGSDWYIAAYTGSRHAAEIDALRFARARGDLRALKRYVDGGGLRSREAEDEILALEKGESTPVLRVH